jgi:alpha-L-fucosidase
MSSRTIGQRLVPILGALAVLLTPVVQAEETEREHDERMAWFREARFGMFIHWGLYAIPAGEWNGETKHAEWIRHSAKIPLVEYEKFVSQFNPTNFNANAWARLAKHAGMKYLVITSKHHDGFCLWDSKLTDFDVMSTPFKRDILKELKRACGRQGIRFATYHSIMDWHHPDYLPRRDWELANRPAGDADFSRYQTYLHGQLRELRRGYRPAILWFDGEWENTWNHQMGIELYDYVLQLDPEIIINNRVDKGRSGMQGLTREGDFRGDFGTPEQEIPPKGLPGVDWESCMTMNDHWGWNKNDKNWKSTQDLVRKLIDIASKGGNFLLNIGPKADGTFPDEAVERLEGIGRWMDKNSESIYGTQASPFDSLPWGRCTRKVSRGSTTLYLHVFDWPKNGELLVPGLRNNTAQAYLLANRLALAVGYSPEGLTITVPQQAPDPVSSTIVLKLPGEQKIGTGQ